MVSRKPFYALAGLVPLVVASFVEAPATQAKVDFQSEIAPIFKASCYSCHSENNALGGLDLTSVQAIESGGISKNLILSGDAENSVLLRRIKGLDGKPQMPMGFKPLSEDKVALIGRWIDEGATFASDGSTPTKHWSYVVPTRPPVPTPSGQGWVKNPIDAFVLQRLGDEGVDPSQPTDKNTFARRAALDIIGVPPSPEQLKAFLEDTSENAHTVYIDKLLASPMFGEKQAVYWLDLARYADTNGYEKDARRSIWPYRDYVINAFNSNMPFDRFTIEQLAGDLLPDPSKNQLIATGFHRNTMLNQEGGVDMMEQRWLTQVDRVGTTGTVWLGSTIACAQCHDHKFDPFSIKDFYAMLAYWAVSYTHLRAHET